MLSLITILNGLFNYIRKPHVTMSRRLAEQTKSLQQPVKTLIKGRREHQLALIL